MSFRFKNLLELFLSMSLIRSYILLCLSGSVFFFFALDDVAKAETRVEGLEGSLGEAGDIELKVGDVDGDRVDELVFYQKSKTLVSIAKKDSTSNSYKIQPNWTRRVGLPHDSLFVAEGTGDALEDILLWRKGQHQVFVIDAQQFLTHDSKLHKASGLAVSPELLTLFSFPDSKLFIYDDYFALFHQAQGVLWQAGNVEDLRRIKEGEIEKFGTLNFGRREYPPLTIRWGGKLHLGYYVIKKGLFGMRAADGSSPKLVLDINRRTNVHAADLDGDGFAEVVAWNDNSNCFEISYFGERHEKIMAPTRTQEVCSLEKGKPVILSEHYEVLHLNQKEGVVLAGFNRLTGDLKMFLKSTKNGLECSDSEPFPVLKKGATPLNCNIYSSFSPVL